MHSIFLKWVEERKPQIDMLKISTDEVNIAENNVNPSVTVDYSSEMCIGRVSVWETGLIDMEVLDSDTGKRLYFEHHQLKDNLDFDKLLENFFATIRKRP